MKKIILCTIVVLASLSAACGDNPASPSTPRKAVKPVPAYAQEVSK